MPNRTSEPELPVWVYDDLNGYAIQRLDDFLSRTADNDDYLRRPRLQTRACGTTNQRLAFKQNQLFGLAETAGTACGRDDY
jgi:hypothetical protein